MATYRLTKRPAPSIVTMVFGSYNEAVAFCKQSTALNPSKPYKQGMDWKVSFVRNNIETAKFERLEHWEKPFQSYNEWKSVEALYHLPVYIEQKALLP